MAILSILNKVTLRQGEEKAPPSKVDMKRCVSQDIANTKVKSLLLLDLDAVLLNPRSFDLNKLYDAIGDDYVFVNSLISIHGFLHNKNAVSFILYVLDFFSSKKFSDKFVLKYFGVYFSGIPSELQVELGKYFFLHFFRPLADAYPDVALEIFQSMFKIIDFKDFKLDDLYHISTVLSTFGENDVYKVFENLNTDSVIEENISNKVDQVDLDYTSLHKKYQRLHKMRQIRIALLECNEKKERIKDDYLDNIVNTFYLFSLNGHVINLSKISKIVVEREYNLPDMTPVYDECVLRRKYNFVVDIDDLFNSYIKKQIDAENWSECNDVFIKKIREKYRFFDMTYLNNRIIIETCFRDTIEDVLKKALTSNIVDVEFLINLFEKWKSFNLDVSFLYTVFKFIKNVGNDDLLYVVVKYLIYDSDAPKWKLYRLLYSVKGIKNCPKTKKLLLTFLPERRK